MNINQMKSNLKMENLYFPDCSIKRESDISEEEYNVDLQRSIKKIEEHIYNVELKLSINKADLDLIVIASAKFTYESDDYSMEENVVNANTVAIMFPFVRSQVSLMTTQPGMSPIVLPPINTAKLK